MVFLLYYFIDVLTIINFLLYKILDFSYKSVLTVVKLIK